MDFKTLFNEMLTTVNQWIDELSPKGDGLHKIIFEASNYSVQAGGKRIRPIIAYGVCDMLGGNTENVKHYACTVEFIHTYSLIHDDLPCMDNDDIRRGKPSCHIAFGEDNALLAGDALLTEAFTILTDTKGIPSENIVRAISYLSSYAGINGMVGGQVLDLQFEETKPTIEEILKMYSLKTCGLIKASCVLGCLACEIFDESKITAAIEYAENLGIAFQIQDDILDIEGDANTLGKPIGSDTKNDKSTAVKYCGLEKSKELVKEYTDKAILSLDVFENDTETLKQFAYMLINRIN